MENCDTCADVCRLNTNTRYNEVLTLIMWFFGPSSSVVLNSWSGWKGGGVTRTLSRILKYHQRGLKVTFHWF